MNSRSYRNLWFHYAAIAALAAAYYGTAELGRTIASTPNNITPVWPPDGIALAAVLLLGDWVAPGIWIGSFLANVWAFLDRTNQLSVLTSILQASAIALGTTGGSLFSAFLLRKSVKNRHPFHRPDDVFRFVTLAGMIGPTVSASIGVLTLCLGGKVPWGNCSTAWFTWWISNVVGILIFTPLILTWSNVIRQWVLLTWRSWHRLGNPPQFLLAKIKDFSEIFVNFIFEPWPVAEISLLLALVVAVGQISFDGGYPIAYIFLPLLIWSAFRFGERGATLLIVIVSAIAILGTVRGIGPFIRPNLNESLLFLQSFVGVIVLTTLVLVSVITEKQKTERTLRQSQANLQAKAEHLQQTLLELKNTQSQLIHTEKISALGQLVAGLAHEVNNPICFVSGNLYHLDQYFKDLCQLLKLYQKNYDKPPIEILDFMESMDLDYLLEDLMDILKAMRLGTDRIQEIMLSLRNFSRMDEGEKQPADLHIGLESTLMILQPRLKDKLQHPPIKVIKEYGNLPLVACYPGQLNQVFMNLLANAIDALNESASRQSFPELEKKPQFIKVKTEIKNEKTAIIRIADNGPGISEAVKQHIFEPFFTTKPIGKGTGLGLSISYQIVVEKHGGKLQCLSTPGQGTEFVIEIPIM